MIETIANDVKAALIDLGIPTWLAWEDKNTNFQDHAVVSIIPGETTQQSIGQDRILRQRGTIAIRFNYDNLSPRTDIQDTVDYFNQTRFFDTWRCLVAWVSFDGVDRDKRVTQVSLRWEQFS